MTAWDFVKQKALIETKKLLNKFITDTGTGPECPCGIAQLNADKTKATLIDGTEIDTFPVGIPTEFSVFCKLHSQKALVKRDSPNCFEGSSGNNPGFVLGRDSTWFYIRKVGQTTKYYLPYTDNLRDKDPSVIQARLSANGLGVLLGTVTENQYTSQITGSLTTWDAGTSIYHQISHYVIFKNISLLSYTAANVSGTDSASYTYPMDLGTGSACIFTGSIANSKDLNLYSDGFVPAPGPGEGGSQSLHFPYSTSNSLFSQFNAITRLNWDADTGYNYIETDCAVDCFDISGQNTNHGDENFTWSRSTNSSIFKNYIYTFNNTVPTGIEEVEYNGDLVSTFVNCYLLAVTHADWNEFIHVTVDENEYPFCPRTFGSQYLFDEDLVTNHEYAYNPDFAYRLEYLPTPDLWLPATGDVVPTTLNKTWVKNASYYSYSTANILCGDPAYSIGPDVTVYDYQGFLDGGGINCEDYYVSGGFTPASQYSYSVCNTTGPGVFQTYPFTQQDEFNFHYYSGLSTQASGQFTIGPNHLGTGCSYAFAPVAYCWVDINYDSLFLTTDQASFAVFSGRSSMVINNLKDPDPNLYGIVTQLLGDGADYNVLSRAFRGRGFTDNVNAAFIYNQNFNGFYRYSSPWLFAGNLGGIGGTGSASLAQSDSYDPYTTAIVQLVDWASLADALDDQATATLINNMISVYRSQTTPSAAAVDVVVAAIITMLPDLNSNGAVTALGTKLKGINASLDSGTPDAIAPDIIGYNLPDVFTDKIFSPQGSWPFPAPTGATNYFLKAPDSYTVQRYYQLDGKEYIRQFDIATSGLTSAGKKSTGKYSIIGENILDYAIPLKS